MPTLRTDDSKLTSDQIEAMSPEQYKALENRLRRLATSTDKMLEFLADHMSEIVTIRDASTGGSKIHQYQDKIYVCQGEGDSFIVHS
ncbi:MAG: hypothetical protein KZQ83_19075 [gamma proteobacterium symbiont of Taylorina sp.]|nr:hypothetical protein [gamma proteobacterium symbiont of Taylorina sp.]